MRKEERPPMDPRKEAISASRSGIRDPWEAGRSFRLSFLVPLSKNNTANLCVPIICVNTQCRRILYKIFSEYQRIDGAIFVVRSLSPFYRFLVFSPFCHPSWGERICRVRLSAAAHSCALFRDKRILFLTSAKFQNYL